MTLQPTPLGLNTELALMQQDIWKLQQCIQDGNAERDADRRAFYLALTTLQTRVRNLETERSNRQWREMAS